MEGYMLERLSLGHIINHLREKWLTLPDMRDQDFISALIDAKQKSYH